MVGAADAYGAIASGDGIDAEKLAEHVREGGKLADFDSGAETIDPGDLVALECDVFIPAALGGMIHSENAHRMSCRLIVEGANSPTTPKTDEILNDKGIQAYELGIERVVEAASTRGYI